MNAADVMSLGAATIHKDASVAEAAKMMLQYGISGLPVLDDNERVVGIVTERDFLRRGESGTELKRPRWSEFFILPGPRAEEYVRSHSRKVSDVMTPNVITVSDDTLLNEVVDLMERHNIKRIPVLRDHKIIGIVSRANLLRLIARSVEVAHRPSNDDQEIRSRILKELQGQSWAPLTSIEIVVREGDVELRGALSDERLRDGIRVAAENVPGVKTITDSLRVVPAIPGMA